MGAMPVPMGPQRNQGGVQGLGSQLYSGGTNATGVPVPMSGNGTGTAMPVTGLSPTKATAQTAIPTTGLSPTTATAATASPGLSVSANPGTSGTPNVTGDNPADQSRLLAENQNYYGQGVGATLTNYLNSGAGYNGALAQQTVNATDNAMQQQINQQYGGLQTSMSNAGLSPNSSASALANSQFLSNASAQENQVAAQQYTQMYSQSQSDYLSALEMVSGVNNQGTINQKTTAGQVGSFLTGGVAGSLQYNSPGAGEAGQVSSSTGPLDALAGLF
jgi:hypothetical protein